MNEVLHANIFFFIASVATVVFCILISLIFYQVFKITKSLRDIIERIEEGSEVIAEDMTNIRGYVAGGGLFTKVVSFFMGMGMTNARSKRKRSETE